MGFVGIADSGDGALRQKICNQFSGHQAGCEEIAFKRQHLRCAGVWEDEEVMAYGGS
jgi:hypothetical protein